MTGWEVWMWDYRRQNHQWLFLWTSCCHMLVEGTCLSAYCEGLECFPFETIFSLSTPILDGLVFILKCSDIVWHWPKRTSQLWWMRQFSLVLNHLSPQVVKFLVLLSCLNAFVVQPILRKMYFQLIPHYVPIEIGLCPAPHYWCEPCCPCLLFAIPCMLRYPMMLLLLLLSPVFLSFFAFVYSDHEKELHFLH